MRRALTDFGVLNPGGQTPPGERRPGQGNNQGGGAGDRRRLDAQPTTSDKKVRVGRGKLRARRSNKSIYVKVWCPATVGSTCRGLLRAITGANTVTERSFSVAANRWRTVRLRLTNRDYRRLVRKRSMKVTTVVTSRADDGVLRRDSARITVLAPKRKR